MLSRVGKFLSYIKTTGKTRCLGVMVSSRMCASPVNASLFCCSPTARVYPPAPILEEFNVKIIILRREKCSCHSTLTKKHLKACTYIHTDNQVYYSRWSTYVTDLAIGVRCVVAHFQRTAEHSIPIATLLTGSEDCAPDCRRSRHEHINMRPARQRQQQQHQRLGGGQAVSSKRKWIIIDHKRYANCLNVIVYIV